MESLRVRIAVAAAALVVGLALASCATVDDAPSLTSATLGSPGPRTPTPSEPSATPSPAASPTPSPSPSAGTALTVSEAYDLCVTKVVRDITESHGVDRDQVVAVPMTEAETVERGDGYFWVWANVTSQLGEPEVRDAGAAYCIVGGTVENPEFAVAGSALRDLRDEFDPHVDFTLFSD